MIDELSQMTGESLEQINNQQSMINEPDRREFALFISHSNGLPSHPKCGSLVRATADDSGSQQSNFFHCTNKEAATATAVNASNAASSRQSIE